MEKHFGKTVKNKHCSNFFELRNLSQTVRKELQAWAESFGVDYDEVFLYEDNKITISHQGMHFRTAYMNYTIIRDTTGEFYPIETELFKELFIKI